jgi:hypothetical protein
LLVNLDVDAALAFLIVQVAYPDHDNQEEADQEEKRVSVHCWLLLGYLKPRGGIAQRQATLAHDPCTSFADALRERRL